MKVFISSVRRGLESERDYLPDLIRALGHLPVRFEDFDAQDLTSRGACLGGVEGSDAYLLLLGEHYGTEISDSGLSPTEEEFNVAVARGLPIYVFKKRDVTPDPQQDSFLARVGSYQHGRFWAEFTDRADLGIAVTNALHGHHPAAPPFVQSQLSRSVEPVWRVEIGSLPASTYRAATLEIHLIPIEGTFLRPVATLSGLAEALASDARQQGFFGQSDALDIGADDYYSWAVRRDSDFGTRRHQEVAPAPYAGICLSRDGSAIAFQGLPNDSLGSLVNEQDLAQRITVLL